MILVTLGCARVVPAQEAQGVVRDALSHSPIAGAVVIELDAQQQSLGRDLTNADGQYRLTLLAGASTLRVLRIGFRPQQLPVPPLVNENFHHDFTLEPLPSLLEPVTVDDAKRCCARADRNQALGLWEQARAGLLASVAAREARSGEMQTLTYERFYSGDTATLTWQQVQHQSERTSRPFLPVWPAADFAAKGYMVTGPFGSALAAPDADVLLDDSFAATHCFSIATADSAHPAQLGLAFDPAPGRERLIDVRGTLWVDRVHPAIRTLEFKYTGLSGAANDGGSGGMLSFRSASNGVVFIDDWRIVSVAASSGRTTQRTFRIVGPSESRSRVTGGRVIAARWDDGTEWTAPTASVAGRVTGRDGIDSAGVFVWLVGTADTTVTDSAGRFHFDTLLPGRYQVDAAARPLAVVGVAQNVAPDSAVASIAGSSDAIVHLDSAARAARRVCGNARDPIPQTVLFVRVMDTDDWLLPNDSVAATWTKPPSKVLGITVSHEGHFDGRTDNDGRVAICDPIRGEPLAIRVGLSYAPQLTTTVTVPRTNPIAVVTLSVGAPGSR